MMSIPSLREETRYGMPAADQVIFNRDYVLGYSYYFRQAKWALEIIKAESLDTQRMNNFRPDYRIPEMFRADLVDYDKSGYDRGHLVSSASKLETDLQNSETFLLSNISPQVPEFNRKIWKSLETKVLELNKKSKILETYVVSGPIFYFDKEVISIGGSSKNKVTLPVPHAYFKSILAETNTGSLYLWSFIIPNEDSNKKLNEFLVPTTRVERFTGIKLWERLVGKKIDRAKNRIKKIW